MIAWTALAASWALSFLLVTQGIGALSKPALLVARAAGALAVVVLAVVARRLRWDGPTRDRVFDAFVVGGLGVGAAAWLEIAYGSRAAPSGAETLFMLSSVPVWVALVDLAKRRARSPDALLASGFLLLANAMILANWERPSTFSPFAVFPQADLALLLAAMAWAVGGVEAERRLSRFEPLTRAAIAGSGAAWLLVFLPSAAVPIRMAAPVDLTLLAAVMLVSGAFLTLAWHEAVAKHGALMAAFACGMAPTLLSALVVLEKTFGAARGPVPLIAGPVAAGALVSMLATAASAGSRARPVGPDARACAAAERDRDPHRGQPWVAYALTGASAAAALAGMVLPSLTSSIESHLEIAPFSATWQTPGVGTVGGWVALLACLAGALAPVGTRRDRIWAVLIASAGLAVAAGGWSPWVSWHWWIPADAQHALGSPYALLTELPVANPGVLLAPWLALGAWWARHRWKPPGRASVRPTT